MPGIRYLARVISGVSFQKLNHILDLVHEKCGQNRILTLGDILWCAVRYGAGYYDYMQFGFYNMNGAQRDTYLTRVRNKKVQELMNDDAFSDEFDDKLRFNVRFAPFLHRETLNGETATEEELAAFLKGQDAVFAKPNHGTCGNGIEKLRPGDFSTVAALQSYIREKGLLALEHELPQHPEMKRLHPSSVNTLRILTDRVGDTVHIAYIVVKIGTGESYCDNSGQGGVICRVDPDTATICSCATDDYFHVYEQHPDTGIPFRGYRIPMLAEAIELAKQAALVIPQTRHVGWDVAITPDGPALIEGNDYPGTDLCQLAPHYPEKCGLWPYYKRILSI